MISINDTHPAPKAAPSYRIRTEAMNAAVATIGPHARHGFEYTTTKCDGRWVWKPTDEVPAPTAAEIKANGGKRSLIALAAAIDGGQTIKPMEGTAMAKMTDGKIVPANLPVPPRRALGKAAGASDGSGATGQPPAPENEPAAHNTSVAGTYEELKAGGGLRSEPVPAKSHLTNDGFFIVNAPCDDLQTREMMLNDLAPACNGLDIKPHDDLSIQDFLKRDTSPEAKEKAAQAMKRVAKQVGPDRVIKAPPDAKVAARRKAADEEAADMAKAKAKRAAKALDGAKPAKTKIATRAKKPASEARTKAAGHLGGKPAKPASKAALIKTAIADWKDDETIVQEVRAAFPGCEYKASDIKWYRRKMAKAQA